MTVASPFRRTLTTATVIAATATGSTLLTTTAQAMPSDQPSCGPGQLTAHVTKDADRPSAHDLYTITFSTHTEGACRLEATPTHLIFHSPNGKPLGVESYAANPASHDETEVWPGQDAQATIVAPHSNMPGAPATSISFDQPTPDGTMLHLHANWPHDVNGPVEIRPLGGTT